ncbi:MAG: Crp/Fnr family transcriptional regulator [Gammaproteobacteria bacterium]|nr:Crp/Fnr family transcriptional regulator [Gammaproteobacteria bacterium]
MANIGATTLLRSSPLFRGLGDATLQRIVDLGANRTYAVDETIYRQGDPGNALYGVISGEVAISTYSKSGQVLRLNAQLPGEITGEIALLDGGSRTATATMSQAGTLFVMNRAPLMNLLESEPKLAIRFIELLCARIRWTSQLLEESAFFTVPERLSSRLLWLSRTSGIESGDGVRVRISQSGLAQWLNVSRQVVNGYLQEWQGAGYLSLGRGAVTIVDPEAMESIR